MKDILYAAYEGYRANLANFYSPCATDFPRMDFTDYIRDHLIGHFPPAMDAYHIREAFIKILPEAAREAERAISGYFTLLGPWSQAGALCWLRAGKQASPMGRTRLP